MDCPTCGITIAATPHPPMSIGACPDCDGPAGAIAFCLLATGRNPTEGGRNPGHIATAAPVAALTYLNRARRHIDTHPELTEAFQAAERRILPMQAQVLK